MPFSYGPVENSFDSSKSFCLLQKRTLNHCFLNIIKTSSFNIRFFEGLLVNQINEMLQIFLKELTYLALSQSFNATVKIAPDCSV